MHTQNNQQKVILITGAAKRIGASLAKDLHSNNYKIIIHYNQSESSARSLMESLNNRRADTATMIQADLRNLDQTLSLAEQAIAYWGRLDGLINNASTYYSTPIGECTPEQWQDLFSSNLKAPFFLAQACVEALKKTRGHIINIADIHGQRPLAKHSMYCMAKAGNIMMTKTLAKELAPEIKVNGIAPGAILWPENDGENSVDNTEILNQIPLKELGNTQSITSSIRFLLMESSYITGQIINVDGGRSLSQ
ncbi:pteridine reductase [Teredinibacter sp. KSP-S5-2]|uniref:pteridine reductase n=1 Tax=Teredinibacter sp. KSP-S5-2 TaxID=3034506 RepID=UPI00293419B7|nr:pteridine reductase [Teredinibacter sp. KSP-S5-2]WNO08607.1 pteridine reductase [Teredinibacter sp. KSP-S5-2]